MFGIPLAASLLLLLTGQDGKVEAFVLKTHKQLTGEVLAIDGDRVTLKVSMFGGTAEIQRELSDFEPDSAYRIMAAKSGDTFADKMKLARFASEVDSMDYLRKELRESYAIAEKEKNEAQMKEVKQFAADCIDKYFNRALAKNDFGFAKQCINLMMMKCPDERTEAQKRAMISRYNTAHDKVLAERMAQQEAKAEKAAVDEANRLLQPVLDKINRAKELENEGLLTGNNNIKARESFDQSIQLLTEAYQKVQQFEKSSNKYLKDHASSLQVQIFDIGKDACLNAASAATFQSDYQGARGYINKVLAIDPHDKDALDARARVEMASSRGWW